MNKFLFVILVVTIGYVYTNPVYNPAAPNPNPVVKFPFPKGFKNLFGHNSASSSRTAPVYGKPAPVYGKPAKGSSFNPFAKGFPNIYGRNKASASKPAPVYGKEAPVYGKPAPVYGKPAKGSSFNPFGHHSASASNKPNNIYDSRTSHSASKQRLGYAHSASAGAKGGKSKSSRERTVNRGAYSSPKTFGKASSFANSVGKVNSRPLGSSKRGSGSNKGSKSKSVFVFAGSRSVIKPLIARGSSVNQFHLPKFGKPVYAPSSHHGSSQNGKPVYAPSSHRGSSQNGKPVYAPSSHHGSSQNGKPVYAPSSHRGSSQNGKPVYAPSSHRGSSQNGKPVYPAKPASLGEVY